MRRKVIAELRVSGWGCGCPMQELIEWDDQYSEGKQEAVIDFIRTIGLKFGKVEEGDRDGRWYRGWERAEINLSGDVCREKDDCDNRLDEEEIEEGICWKCKEEGE